MGFSDANNIKGLNVIKYDLKSLCYKNLLSKVDSFAEVGDSPGDEKEKGKVDIVTIGIYGGAVVGALMLIFCCVLCCEKCRKSRRNITEIVELQSVDIKTHRARIAQLNKNKKTKRGRRPAPGERPDSPPPPPPGSTLATPQPDVRPTRMPVPIMQRYDDDSDEGDYHSSKGGTKYRSKEVDFNMSESSRPLRNADTSLNSTQEWRRAAKGDVSTSGSMHLKSSPFKSG